MKKFEVDEIIKSLSTFSDEAQVIALLILSAGTPFS